jgi:hypothetical protein
VPPVSLDCSIVFVTAFPTIFFAANARPKWPLVAISIEAMAMVNRAAAIVVVIMKIIILSMFFKKYEKN